VVHDQPHADTDSITTEVRQEFGPVSHQAVYGVIHVLTAAGLPVVRCHRRRRRRGR
jgi:Fur family ferric uptake transcriptional regulator